MNTTPPTVCILGAGPSGIAAAFFAQRKGLRVVLIEEKDLVGGKGASRKVDDYIFDFGPHAYHPKSAVINELVRSHSGADYLKTTVRMELILKGKNMNYPFNFKEALWKFNPFFSLKILGDYLLAKVRNFFTPLPEKSFRDWGLKQYGKTLYDLCFGNYTERVWKVPAGQLSVELARRKLPRFSILSLLHDLIYRKGKLHSHIFTNELGYHRDGMGSVYEKIVEGIIGRGGELLNGSKPLKLQHHANGNGFSLELEGTGKLPIYCDYVISSIPLPELLTVLGRSDGRFLPLAPRLSFRHILLIYVVLDIPRFSRAHWTYLVDDRFHFHRISEQKNLSAACAPPDKTVLTMEISCSGEDPMWNWEPHQFREMVKRDLAFFKIPDESILNLYSSKLEDAYPIYAIDFEKGLASCLEELASVPGLITTGRQGLFLDIDMHDAMVLGEKAVESVLSGSVATFYKENSVLLRRPV